MTTYLTPGDRCRFGLTAAVLLVDFALLPFAPFPVVWLSFKPVLFWLVAMGLIWTTYTFWRPAPPLATAAIATAQILLFTLGAAILNYLGFMAGRPSFDANLVAADRLIGFDWLHFVAWVSSVPHADDVLLLAYNSSIPQVSAIVVFLALSGRFERLDQFTLSFMITALIIVGFWTAFPTFGPYIYYFGLGETVPERGLAVYPAYARSVVAMQNGVFSPLRFDNILGLIGFPSFHTSLAILCAFALRGIRWLGPIALLGNLIVLVSVPGQGGHHLVDVFGGVIVVVIAISLTDLILAGRMAAPRRMSDAKAG